MVPRIFISSTIRDLLHVRYALRELVVELGYIPVMSEHGEVGYLPHKSAADSCYDESKDCDIGILIIGKRYGDDDKNGASVTENEYRSLLSEKIPLITVIEKDVLTYKALFDANNKSGIGSFPGMDHPTKTFSFISAVMSSPYNNGAVEFSHIGEARDYIRKQVAHIFGYLLRQRADSIRTDLKDVLAAMHSLRQDFLRVHQDPNSNRFLRASRHLLDDSANYYRKFLEQTFNGFEESVKKIIECETFEDLLTIAKYRLIIQPNNNKIFSSDDERREKMSFGSHWSFGPQTQWIGYYVLKDKTVLMDQQVKEQFESLHLRIRRESGM